MHCLSASVELMNHEHVEQFKQRSAELFEDLPVQIALSQRPTKQGKLTVNIRMLAEDEEAMQTAKDLLNDLAGTFSAAYLEDVTMKPTTMSYLNRTR